MHADPPLGGPAHTHVDEGVELDQEVIPVCCDDAFAARRVCMVNRIHEPRLGDRAETAHVRPELLSVDEEEVAVLGELLHDLLSVVLLVLPIGPEVGAARHEHHSGLEVLIHELDEVIVDLQERN